MKIVMGMLSVTSSSSIFEAQCAQVKMELSVLDQKNCQAMLIHLNLHHLDP